MHPGEPTELSGRVGLTQLCIGQRSVKAPVGSSAVEWVENWVCNLKVYGPIPKEHRVVAPLSKVLILNCF